MADQNRRGGVSKVYCERCDAVFGSRSEFERHLDSHCSTGCESCPIDTAISRIVRFFRHLARV